MTKINRNDFNDKIRREAKEIFDLASEDDLTNFHSEVEIKTKLRDELLDASMTDETVQALWAKGNVLESAYRFFTEESKDNQVHLAMFEYLEKTEHEYLAEKVFDMVKAEYESYIDEVKKMPPEKIVDEAYKISILYDIYISLDPDTSSVSAERLRALHSIDKPLWCLYHTWMKRDITYMDDITDVIKDVANERIAENAKSSFDVDYNPFEYDEVEDGQEL
jgi:hypothetical protein